jgi:hypothetical protein
MSSFPSLELFKDRLLRLDDESTACPEDERFQREFIGSPMYERLGGRLGEVILRAIEAEIRDVSLSAAALTEELRVEPIWPLSPRPGAWPTSSATAAGAVDYGLRAKHQQLVHSIGNLTLVTADFDPSLRDAAFSEKQIGLARERRVKLNAMFDGVGLGSDWGEDQIHRRAAALYDVAKRLWPFPGPALTASIIAGPTPT